jgi:formyltetrahydrofolate-dependent phosphoribosylglycinamide formyltransferase
MAKSRIGILISGRGSNMEALIAAARAPDCPYEVVLVASNDPEAAGLKTAQNAGIGTFAHPHKGLQRAEFDAIIDRALRDANVEYIALAGYMRILSEDFIAGWKDHILNIHPSLLPKYKGLDTHARAIEAGDAEAGCSVHIVTPTLDDGPVLAQARVPVLPGDTPDLLAARILIEEHRLYPATLAAYIRQQT